MIEVFVCLRLERVLLLTEIVRIEKIQGVLKVIVLERYSMVVVEPSCEVDEVKGEIENVIAENLS